MYRVPFKKLKWFKSSKTFYLICVSKRPVARSSVTREFQPVAKRIFFYFISPWSGTIFAKICGNFTKMFYAKSTFRMQLQGKKTMILDFINKSSKTFNFLLNFVFIKLSHSTATKDLWSKKPTRHSYKRCRNFEEYCVWKGQATKEKVCKKN